MVQSKSSTAGKTNHIRTIVSVKNSKIHQNPPSFFSCYDADMQRPDSRSNFQTGSFEFSCPSIRYTHETPSPVFARLSLKELS